MSVVWDGIDHDGDATVGDLFREGITSMGVAQLIDDLGDWARLAGRGARAESGGVVFFTDPGGEVRDYVREVDDAVVVTQVQRSSAEVFEMSATNVEDAAKFLVVRFGFGIRTRMGLPYLRIPLGLDAIAEGWNVKKVDDRWVAASGLSRRLATFARGSSAAEFTHYGDRGVDEIRGSFLDPKGSPYGLLDPL